MLMNVIKFNQTKRSNKMATQAISGGATGGSNDTLVKGGLFNTETTDKAYGFPIGDDGKRKDAVMLDPQEAEKLGENKFDGSVVTVRVSYPASFEGLLALANAPAKDEEGNLRDQKDVQAEIVRVFNAGAKIKVNNDTRALLTKVNDKGELVFNESTDLEDGFLDMTNSITRGSRRIFLTEEQKTWKNLSNLTGDVKINVWRAYLAATGKDYYVPAE